MLPLVNFSASNINWTKQIFTEQFHKYSERNKCQSEFYRFVNLGPPVVSCTLLLQLSNHISSSSALFCFIFPIHSVHVLFLSERPCPGFVSLSGLGMKLLAFVRLSEVEREAEGEIDLLVEQVGCICNSRERIPGIAYKDCIWIKHRPSLQISIWSSDCWTYWYNSKLPFNS